MKLPIPFLLYVIALGLFGLAGWTVYGMLPLWKGEVRGQANKRGTDVARDRITRGQALGPSSRDWVYSGETQPWWARFKDVNLTGKLPPPPAEPTDGKPPPPPPTVFDTRPLDQLIELVCIVYDGTNEGKGGRSHAIVRFKQEANVQPPEWWVKENTPATPTAAGGGPRDVARPANTVNASKPASLPVGRGGTAARPSPIPTAPVSAHQAQQAMWVDPAGDVRREPTLWPIKSNDGKEIGKIRLVRIAPDAQSAFFVRELPAGPDGKVPEAKEEELIKTEFDLSQDILRVLREHQGKAVARDRTSEKPKAASTAWMEVEQTTRVGDTYHFGRRDAQRFRDGTDNMLERLTVDFYVSKKGTTRGLIVKAIDAELASLGVAVGEVLVEINGKKVESKGQAVALVKEDYNRGVRTFATKWMSNGQMVDRTYQAPDK
jgi:hypothetical protein